MSRWVVDSSLALAWGLPDERSPSADRFWDHVGTGSQLWVPSLWKKVTGNPVSPCTHPGNNRFASGG